MMIVNLQISQEAVLIAAALASIEVKQLENLILSDLKHTFLQSA